MEFEKLQQIWDIQNQRPLYVINEEALHRHIESKKKQARHITNVSELLVILANVGTGGFTLVVSLSNHHTGISMYLMSAWMFIVALYVTICRVQRMKAEKRFDRSMLGDLHHALSVATYQVRLSQLLRWIILPVAALVLGSFWEGGKSMWILLGALFFFVITYYASGWEHRWYKSRKLSLEQLKHKLEKPEKK